MPADSDRRRDDLPVSRRRLLAATAASTAGLAGCGGGNDGTTQPPGTTPVGGTGTATETTPATERTEMPEPPTASGARYFVSPEGDDDWDGRQPAPGEGDSGPFATLEAARDAIREQTEGPGLPDGGVAVVLRGGVYNRLEDSFELGERDSGTEDAPIVYRSYEDEHVRLSGGQRLDGDAFRPVGDAVRERLPEGSRDEVLEYDLAADGITEFGEIVQTGLNLSREPPTPELFVDGESLEVARWPNDGWLDVGAVHDPGATPRDLREYFHERPLPPVFDESVTFEYTNERIEGWADYENVWMEGYWWNNYATSNLQIQSVDEAANTITTEQSHLYGVRSEGRYYYYNVLDELDEPGEFYIDREAGMLYVYPPTDLASATVELSTLGDPIVRMEGTDHVSFRDVEFSVTRGSAVQMVDCSHCQVRECRVARTGTTGVVLGDSIQKGDIGGNRGGHDNAVVDCEIVDTGMGGVRLGGGDRASLTPSDNVVARNEIHRFSRVTPTYTPAVWPTGVGGRIAHNHIHTAPHQAIFINGNEHVIEKNDIHDVVQDTSDSGAIYMGRDWSEVGTVIRNNYIHHLQSEVNDGGGQFAVYLDDLASGIRVLGNVFYEVPIVFSLGGGRRNRFENNLMVDCEHTVQFDARGTDPDWPHCRRRSAGGTGVLFERLNAVPYTDDPWASRYPWLSTVPTDDPCLPKHNTVSCNVAVDAGPMEIAETARRLSTVENNLRLQGDVGFEDRANEQFSLESDSRIFDRLPCFESIPFGEIGRTTEEPG